MPSPTLTELVEAMEPIIGVHPPEPCDGTFWKCCATCASFILRQRIAQAKTAEEVLTPELLTDETEEESDLAYNQAVNDCIKALRDYILIPKETK